MELFLSDACPSANEDEWKDKTAIATKEEEMKGTKAEEMKDREDRENLI